MLNRIFKTKFDPATGLSYAVSELGKSHNVKNKSLMGLGLVAFAVFSSNANAQCAADTDPHIDQRGGTCSYDRSSIFGTDASIATIDLRDGATATFTATDLDLKKRNGYWIGSYAAIYLRKEDTLTNKAIFEGNVTIQRPEGVRSPRPVVVAGGNDLLIKGNVNITHSDTSGVVFIFNGDTSTWRNERNDTRATIQGDVTIDSNAHALTHFGNGHFIFEKDVNVTASNGSSIHANDHTNGTLEFKGTTTINDSDNRNQGVFVSIAEGATSKVIFNKLNLNRSGTSNLETFLLQGGRVTLLNDSTLTAPNAPSMVKLYNGATFENGGHLTFTSKDGILVHSIAEAGKNAAVFNNLENGVITNDKHIAMNDGAGTLEINNAGKLTSTTDEIFKNTTDGIISATNTGILEGFLTSGDNDSLSLTNDTTGIWNNTKDSSLDTLVNKGTINFIAPADKSHLTISTDKYTGGGTLVMNTIWTDSDTSTSDKLKIKTIEGDAVTTVKLVGEKFDAITAQPKEQSTVNVIEVENDHSGNLFVGTAKTNSPQEAQLARVGNNYVWTVEAIIEEPEPQPQPPVDNPPADPNTPQPEKPKPKTVPIISQPVVGYVQQPFINRQMGFAQMGKLHERVGEQRHLAWKNGVAANQLWGRISHDYTMLQGKERFGANVKSGFVQFGRDIQFKLNQDNSQQHTGLTFTYGWATSKFFDKYRAENGVVVADKYTGGAKSDMFSLGGYHTYYSPTGAYVDVVGQVSWLQNRYNSDFTQVKQKGYGLGASIEVGKPFPLLNPQVTVEPQAQLSYQSIWLNGFNDGDREVKKSRQDSLIGRVGVRVNWSETLEKNSPQLYFTVNLMQTLTGKGSQIVVGNQKVEERFGDLAAEFGIGGQYPIKPNLSIYADFRHVISLKGENRVHRDSDLSRKSYNGRIGIRYSW